MICLILFWQGELVLKHTGTVAVERQVEIVLQNYITCAGSALV